MPWYRNHYHCTECGTQWSDDWDCMCDDRCPECDRSMSPEHSEEIEPEAAPQPAPLSGYTIQLTATGRKLAADLVRVRDAAAMREAARAPKDKRHPPATLATTGDAGSDTASMAAEEATPEGIQYVVPGCEKITPPKSQGDLF